jgi:hypothetical protein
MGMFMFFFIMGRVLVFMCTMLPDVTMVMHMDVSGMLVGVGMLVQVLVAMGVSMLVGVNHLVMLMFMVMRVGVIVGMQVFVLMCAFHDHPSLDINFLFKH